MCQKSGNGNFDLSIGCYDGAQVCELFESFILNKLASVTNRSNIGLYRDDGLETFQNISKSESERKDKAIVKFL